MIASHRCPKCNSLFCLPATPGYPKNKTWYRMCSNERCNHIEKLRDVRIQGGCIVIESMERDQ